MEPRRVAARLLVEAVQRGLRGTTTVTRRTGKLLRPDRVAEARELRDGPDGETLHVNRPDGARVRVHVAGDGPDVVLAHGYALGATSWNPVAHELVDAGHRVVTLDWRAHGGSTAPTKDVTALDLVGDLRAVLDHVDVRDGVLVGHSTGGYVSMAMLVEHPDAAERLRGLVLVATLAGRLFDDEPTDPMSVFGRDVPLRLLNNRSLWLLLAGFGQGVGVSSAVAHELLTEFAATDHAALVSLLADLAGEGYYDRIDTIALPTRVLYGDEDRTTPMAHGEAIVEAIVDATGEVVEGAGHLLNWQHPERIVEAVLGLAEELT